MTAPGRSFLRSPVSAKGGEAPSGGVQTAVRKGDEVLCPQQGLPLPLRQARDRRLQGQGEGPALKGGILPDGGHLGNDALGLRQEGQFLRPKPRLQGEGVDVPGLRCLQQGVPVVVDRDLWQVADAVVLIVVTEPRSRQRYPARLSCPRTPQRAWASSSQLGSVRAASRRPYSVPAVTISARSPGTRGLTARSASASPCSGAIGSPSTRMASPPPARRKSSAGRKARSTPPSARAWAVAAGEGKNSAPPARSSRPGPPWPPAGSPRRPGPRRRRPRRGAPGPGSRWLRAPPGPPGTRRFRSPRGFRSR